MISYYFLLLGSFFIGAFKNSLLIYLFFLTFIYELYVKYKKRVISIDDLVIMANLYSVILPDNYLIIIVNVISILYLLSIRGINKIVIENKSWIIFSCFILIYGLVISAFNQFSLIKFAFVLLYLSVTIFTPILLKSYKFNFNKLSNHLKIIIISQLIAIIGRLLFRLKEIMLYNDLDWICGTFGEYQSTILFIFCIFSSIYFSFLYGKFKTKNNLVFALLSLFIAFSTGTIALTILFIFITLFFLFLNFGKKKFFKFFPLFIIATLSFLYVNPPWIRTDLINLMDYNYLIQRVSKIETYKDTFITLSDDMTSYLLGYGLGNYTSRTALTTTGLYINSYNSFFKPIISKQTGEYIYPKLQYVYDNRLGTLDTPFSTIITIKGELGLFGLFFLFFVYVFLFKKSNKFQRYILSLLFVFCFFENYIEFAKVVFPFMLFFHSMKNIEKNEVPINKKWNQKVSICIPTHNNEETLSNCVEAIESQEYNNIEIILVENNSTDRTPYVCKSLSEKYSNVIYSSTKAIGVSNARNMALSLVTGDIIGFCDADDYYEKNIISNVVSNLDDASIIVGGYNVVDSNNIIQSYYLPYNVLYDNDKAIPEFIINSNILGSVCNKFYKADLLQGVCFDTEVQFLEDLQFNCQVLKKIKGDAVKILNYPIYNYCINAESVTQSVNRLFDNNGNLKYVVTLDDLKTILGEKYYDIIDYNKVIICIDTLYNFNLTNDQIIYLLGIVKANLRPFFKMFFEMIETNIKYLVKIILIILQRFKKEKKYD